MRVARDVDSRSGFEPARLAPWMANRYVTAAAERSSPREQEVSTGPMRARAVRGVVPDRSDADSAGGRSRSSMLSLGIVGRSGLFLLITRPRAGDGADLGSGRANRRPILT